jgi:hypothetical protein
MTAKPPKRPRDLNQWAKRMVDLATGSAQEIDSDMGNERCGGYARGVGGRQLRRPLVRTLEYVAPCDQYDRDHDYYRYRHLTGDAVENATFFRVTGLHCHNYLLG